MRRTWFSSFCFLKSSPDSIFKTLKLFLNITLCIPIIISFITNLPSRSYLITIRAVSFIFVISCFWIWELLVVNFLDTSRFGFNQTLRVGLLRLIGSDELLKVLLYLVIIWILRKHHFVVVCAGYQNLTLWVVISSTLSRLSQMDIFSYVDVRRGKSFISNSIITILTCNQIITLVDLFILTTWLYFLTLNVHLFIRRI